MSLTRRSLLVACSGAMLRCGIDQSLPATIVAGPASALTAGSLRAVPGVAVAIGRDSEGIYALSLYCTHEGCDMSSDGRVSASGISCFCHGSAFDALGNVRTGPARQALPHLLVSEDAAGQLTIHGGQQVPASTRLPA